MMMKSRKPLLFAFTMIGLLSADNLIAQEAAQETPAPASSASVPSTASTSPAAATSSPATAVLQTPQGELTIHSVAAPAPSFGPPPPFEQLSAGGKTITDAQAAAYPPLANDFIHADSNKNGSISKAEYERWVKQM